MTTSHWWALIRSSSDGAPIKEDQRDEGGAGEMKSSRQGGEGVRLDYSGGGVSAGANGGVGEGEDGLGMEVSGAITQTSQLL